MLIMAESPANDEYDLYDLSAVEPAQASDEDCHGIQLECWGRAGYQLPPRLSEIFLPSHVVTHPEPEPPDSEFHRLGGTVKPLESFSLYTVEKTRDDQTAAVEPPVNNLNAEDNDAQVDDEIFMSDSSNCSESEEKNWVDKLGVSTNKQGINNKIVATTKDCSTNSNFCETKDGAVMDWLHKNDFVVNRPQNQDYLVVRPSNKVAENISKPKYEYRDEITLLNHVASEKDDAEHSPVATANYLINRKENEEDLISTKSEVKKSKSKKKNKRQPAQSKDRKNKNDPMSFAELQMLAEREKALESCNGQEVDELQLYYAHGYYTKDNTVSVSSQFDFPELPSGGLEKEEKTMRLPTKPQFDLKSLANSIIVNDCEQYMPQDINQNEPDVGDSSCDILMIENLPHDLSSANLKSFLEDYGRVCDISISRVGAKLIAAVSMDCELEWVAELLHGSCISGDSGPLSCYVKKRNVR